MLVLTAPKTDDPRDGGFNHAIPGELLCRPIVCDAGRDGGCGCERSWAGIGSQKATTLAEVVDRPHMTRAEYLGTIGLYLMDAWGYSDQDAFTEAAELADTAEHFGAGALVTIDIDGDSHVFDALEVDRG
ncbi:hypothetical protein ACIBP6_43115 [Nonomuraea terrae]|uniref:DUF7715 family protein n=1 Tax=Nonomuraea terrae TaxID=2530383 RepID=UPI0037B98015